MNAPPARISATGTFILFLKIVFFSFFQFFFAKSFIQNNTKIVNIATINIIIIIIFVILIIKAIHSFGWVLVMQRRDYDNDHAILSGASELNPRKFKECLLSLGKGKENACACM